MFGPVTLHHGDSQRREHRRHWRVNIFIGARDVDVLAPEAFRPARPSPFRKFRLSDSALCK